MFYSYLWIAFAIATAMSLILQSLTVIGICFLVAAAAMLLYELIYFRKIQFLAFWVGLAGSMMAAPACLQGVKKLLYGWGIEDTQPEDILLLMVLFYAVCLLVENAVDFVMRNHRCKEEVDVCKYEKTKWHRGENRASEATHTLVYTYTYDNKKYILRDGEIRMYRGNRHESTKILIDKNCPQYAKTSEIQGRHILKMVVSIAIVWLFVVVFVNR